MALQEENLQQVPDQPQDHHQHLGEALIHEAEGQPEVFTCSALL